MPTYLKLFPFPRLKNFITKYLICSRTNGAIFNYMDIRNSTQFVNFIKKGGLKNLDMTFMQLSQCIEKISHACNCHRSEDKQKMYNNCNVIYMNAVRGVVPRF